MERYLKINRRQFQYLKSFSSNPGYSIYVKYSKEYILVYTKKKHKSQLIRSFIENIFNSYNHKLLNFNHKSLSTLGCLYGINILAKQYAIQLRICYIRMQLYALRFSQVILIHLAYTFIILCNTK